MTGGILHGATGCTGEPIAREVVRARIRTANGYSLTVTGALAMVKQVLNHPVPGSAYTLARLAGWELVTRLPGSGELVIERSERQQQGWTARTAPPFLMTKRTDHGQASSRLDA